MSLVAELIEHLGLSYTDIARIIASAPARYKVYDIPKRNGGMRTIAQPARELKAIQRYILSTKLIGFPVHDAATGYVTGRSILDNATNHRRSRVMLKLDFKDFFPSIKVRDWVVMCEKTRISSIDYDDIAMYSKLLFWGQTPKSVRPRCLSIGAPTSPTLSNIIMYDIDQALAAVADNVKVIYTRYADDITASGSERGPVLEFEAAAQEIVRSAKSPKLTFRDDKRGLYGIGQRRMVTGLVVTPTRQISIGRARKRTISALMHRSTLGQLSEEKRGFLKGMLGFCKSNEPDFVQRLRIKYGNEAVDQALAYRVPKRRVENNG